MFTTRVLLHAILWSLGLAALIGVWVVLTAANNQTADRMMGTLLLTGGCSTILLGVVSTMSRGQPGASARAAIGLATAVVAVEFILALALIWDVPTQFDISNTLFDQILAFIFALGATGMSGVVCIYGLSRPNMRAACGLGAVLSAVILVLWFIAIIKGPDNNSSWQWWEYGHNLFAMGTLSALCLVGQGQDRRHWRWIGVVAACIAYLLIVQRIRDDNWENLQTLRTIITIAILTAYANLALRAPLKPRQKWLAYACVIAAIVTSLPANLVLMDAAAHFDSQWSTHQRLAAAGAIVTSCGTLALAVVAALNRRALRHAVAIPQSQPIPQPAGVEIRAYQNSDRDAVIALWKSVFPGSPAHNDPSRDIDRKLAVQPELFLVAAIDGKPIGTAMAGDDGHRGCVYYVAVDPAHRRKGIATTLMRNVEATLAARGCIKLNLMVRPDNTAVVGFYESLGYKVEERVNMAKMLA